MEEQNEAYQLLLKFLTEETSPEEKITVLEWINESPEHKEIYFRVKDIVNHIDYEEVRLAPDQAVWRNISGKAKVETKRTGVFKLNRSYLKYAAAVLFTLAFSILIVSRYYGNHEVTSISVALNEGIKKVVLPDQSIVWLKPGSSLQYSPDFNGKERNVRLIGEAFFEITKVKAKDGHRKSFTVKSSNLEVSVLGTSFNVIDTRKSTAVIVRTGLVKTKAGTESQLLHPGDRAQLQHSKLNKDQVDVALFTSWRTGDYKFNQTTITEVVQLLENYTNCDVVILNPEKFKQTRLLGRVQAKTENQLLNILQDMLSAKITKQNHTITIN
ncbi:FecR domain-containing protein [Pedobacter sp. PLR]|uniref:FecR family protein n=1 Tax=Pedobacter sp. PLR TaxID=2994465 RepID=UPI0022465E6C|nr:FecR domain-containing protein [Pedobacter sp. PLR]MCX2451225.1 FecR domain-containing protein [Pedobacter sp. PLR]